MPTVQVAGLPEEWTLYRPPEMEVTELYGRRRGPTQPNNASWSAEPIDGRRVAVYRAKIVIEQVDVATSDLERRGAVAEDSL